MQNSSAQIKKCKSRCRPSCPVLCCLQRDTVTVVSYTDTKHERSQYCFKRRNGKMKRLQYWTIWNVFSAVYYLSESSLPFCSESAFGRNTILRKWSEVYCGIMLYRMLSCDNRNEVKQNIWKGFGAEYSRNKAFGQPNMRVSGKTLVWDLLPDTVGQNR